MARIPRAIFYGAGLNDLPCSDHLRAFRPFSHVGYHWVTSDRKNDFLNT